MRGGIFIDTKKLTQIEIENIIDKAINISIITKLLKMEVINKDEFDKIKIKIDKFYKMA